jgi:hypothetical protein
MFSATYANMPILPPMLVHAAAPTSAYLRHHITR